MNMQQISKDHIAKAKTAKGWRKILLYIGAVVTAGLSAAGYAWWDDLKAQLAPEPPATEQPAPPAE